MKKKEKKNRREEYKNRKKVTKKTKKEHKRKEQRREERKEEAKKTGLRSKVCLPLLLLKMPLPPCVLDLLLLAASAAAACWWWCCCSLLLRLVLLMHAHEWCCCCLLVAVLQLAAAAAAACSECFLTVPASCECHLRVRACCECHLRFAACCECRLSVRADCECHLSVGTCCQCHSSVGTCLFAAQWSVRPIAPACQHTFSAQSSSKNAPTHWTEYPWGGFSPDCPPPYDNLNSGSPEHAGLRERILLRLRLTVQALYAQAPLFSDLSGAVSTLVLTIGPSQCVPGQVQDSCRAPVTVNVLTPNLNRVRRSRHLHICCLRSSAPAPAVPCSPMPLVTSVNQIAAFQVCIRPARVCLVDHVLHGICPNVMTLGSPPRAVDFYSRGA